VAAAPAPRPAPAPTTTTTTTSASAGGSASAQIGAYNTREQAQTALAARAGGRATRIEPVERNGTTLYRAMVLFPDRAAAQAFCPSGCIIR
jgi:cell division septation protein DedD